MSRVTRDCDVLVCVAGPGLSAAAAAAADRGWWGGPRPGTCPAAGHSGPPPPRLPSVHSVQSVHTAAIDRACVVLVTTVRASPAMEQCNGTAELSWQGILELGEIATLLVMISSKVAESLKILNLK